MKNRLSIKIITLFPQFVENFVESFGIVKRAIKLKLLEIKPINLRKFGLDERQTVDGRPYGGGVGMVLRPDVLLKAIQKSVQFSIFNFPACTCLRQEPMAGRQFSKKQKQVQAKTRIILLTPQGKRFDQKMAQRLSKFDNLVFVCGRYEGFDERVRQFVDEEISIGDYVLMGGELPALVITEAVVRLRPGILGKDESTKNESFSDTIKTRGRAFCKLLEYPQYTKPDVLKIKNSKLKIQNFRVPKILLTGHHKNIEEWRQKEALKRTKKRRPDLVQNNKLAI